MVQRRSRVAAFAPPKHKEHRRCPSATGNVDSSLVRHAQGSPNLTLSTTLLVPADEGRNSSNIFMTNKAVNLTRLELLNLNFYLGAF
jgi:hypothetical protein